MEIRFQDVKSATLACEQLLEAGFALPQFRMEVRCGEPEKSSPAHQSVMERVKALFGHGTKAAGGQGAVDETELLDGPQSDVLLTIKVDGLTREARSILVQHGGYIESRKQPGPGAESPGGPDEGRAAERR